MNDSPAQVIRQMLIDLGVGVMPDNQTDWSIYASFLPDPPNNALCVYDTQGLQQGRQSIDGMTIEFYGLQVTVRATDTVAYDAKLKQITQAFDAVRRQVVVIGESVYRVQAVNQQGPFIRRGREVGTTHRRLFSINAVASITMVGTAGTGSGTSYFD